MPNGAAKPSLDAPSLVLPPVLPQEPTLWCHRFYAPIVFPEPDKLDPRRANITPRLGNFPCVKTNCMLWNEDKQECWDRTQARALSVIAEYAFNKMNDVHMEPGA